MINWLEFQTECKMKCLRKHGADNWPIQKVVSEISFQSENTLCVSAGPNLLYAR